ncbi:hypothetical protein CR513_05220, partial [Mucuna pruriens]
MNFHISKEPQSSSSIDIFIIQKRAHRPKNQWKTKDTQLTNLYCSKVKTTIIENKELTFFDACHIDMWDVVKNDNYIPTNKEGVEILRSLWNKEQKTR